MDPMVTSVALRLALRLVVFIELCEKPNTSFGFCFGCVFLHHERFGNAIMTEKSSCENLYPVKPTRVDLTATKYCCMPI